MTCREYTEKIIDWIEGELPAAEASEVAEHIAHCACCTQEEKQIREALAAVAAPTHDPGEEYFEKFYNCVHCRIDTETQSVPLLTRLRQFFFGAELFPRMAMATLALGLLVFGGLFASGVINPFDNSERLVKVAGVHKVKTLPPHISALVATHPEIQSALAELSAAQLSELEHNMSSPLLVKLLNGRSLPPFFEMDPLFSPPAFIDLNDREVVDLADQLARETPELPI